MFASKTKLYPLFAALLLVACASAGKRFEQGMDLETQGQYEAASERYAQALEKDPNLTEARARLQESGEMAIAQRLEDAEHWATRNEPVNAAHQYHRVDHVRSRARSVGVRLAVPADYEEGRRGAFDEAIVALMESGDYARRQSRWPDGISAYRQARSDYEPNGDQRDASLAGEATLLVDWSENEYSHGHLHEAYQIASRVQDLEWSPEEESGLALQIMDQALLEGEVELLVLPIRSNASSRHERQRDRELLREVDLALQAGPWRQAPPFVSLHDPLAARDLINHTGLLDQGHEAATMALILRLAEADYGTSLRLLSSEQSEFDVRSTTRTVRTRDGRSVSFVQEDGQRRIQAEAHVVIFDEFGNAITDVTVAGTGSASFSRGVYQGDPAELNLSGRQADLFDRFTQDSQLQAAQQALAKDLASRVADAVYTPVLAQVP